MFPLQQIHLNRPNMSFRGVRLRVLVPSQVAESEIDASRELEDSEALNTFAHRKKLEPEVAKRMIAEYTDAGVPVLQAEGVCWHKTTLAELSLPGTPKSFDALFRAFTRDTEILHQAYRLWHEIDAGDTEDLIRTMEEAADGTARVHLCLPFMSKRVVKLARLTPQQKAESEVTAGKAAVDGFWGFRKAVQFETSKRMIVAYSEELEPVLPKDPTPEAREAARLEFEKQVTVARWTQAEAVTAWPQFDQIFAARDLAFIDELNKRWHDVRPDEVDAILGKPLQVAAPA